MKMGLTGSIATGKTSVSQLLKEMGAHVIDLDMISHEVTAYGTPGLKAIMTHFGEAILQSDGTLNRHKLATHIFSHPQDRKKLEQIIHPLIFGKMKLQMKDLAKRFPGQLIVGDVPLLFEAHLELYFDQIMVVYATKQQQLERLLLRNSLTKEEALQRINSQIDIEEKKKRADFVIDNSGSIEQTKAQLQCFYEKVGLQK